MLLSLATAHLYYHNPYLLVNNFFHFFIFVFVIRAHNQVAVLTTNDIISRHSGIVNNVFAFYLFQTIHTILFFFLTCSSSCSPSFVLEKLPGMAQGHSHSSTKLSFLLFVPVLMHSPPQGQFSHFRTTALHSYKKCTS